VGQEYNEKKFPVQTSSILHDGLVGAGLLSSVGRFRLLKVSRNQFWLGSVFFNNIYNTGGSSETIGM